MREQVFYREPWTPERVQFIYEWWPHFGTYFVAEQTGLTRRQVKSKADRLGLKMLPKTERRCLGCNSGRQFARRAGHYCRDCFSERRKQLRRSQIVNDPLKERMKELVRTITYRTAKRGGVCDVTVEFLLDLYRKQDGRCIYTGVPMTVNAGYGRGRDPAVISIDRIDSSGHYTRANVALCTWWANLAKSDMEPEQFVDWCALVLVHLDPTSIHPHVLEEYRQQILQEPGHGKATDL